MPPAKEIEVKKDTYKSQRVRLKAGAADQAPVPHTPVDTDLPIQAGRLWQEIC
jgi:hypothetical protein